MKNLNCLAIFPFIAFGTNVCYSSDEDRAGMMERIENQQRLAIQPRQDEASSPSQELKDSDDRSCEESKHNGSNRRPRSDAMVPYTAVYKMPQ